MKMLTKSVLAAVLLLAAVPSASGHGDLREPPSRNLGGNNGHCPHCGNGGGVCGDGGQWPGGSNFVNYYDGSKRSYTAGQVAEFEIRITAHHKGHFEFHICDEQITGQTPNPEGASGCLNKWVLERVPPEESYSDCVPNDPRGDCQILDVDHPERWYLPPITGSHLEGWTHKMRFRIPQGLQCQSCTLQWRWWSANSCIPKDGYGCYYQRINAAGWNWIGGGGGVCSSLLQSNASSHAQALSGRGCGEEFRNCADITVVADDGSSPLPTPSPSPPPAPMPTPPAPTPTPPTPSGSSCMQNKNCDGNPWCTDPVFATWCAQHSAAQCPSPQCTTKGSAPAPPAPTPMPTPMPTLMPTTAMPTAPSPMPTTIAPAPAPTMAASQLFVVESAGAASGVLSSGDEIFLRVADGKRLTVQGESVHAKWDHQASWQRLIVEKKSGGTVSSGDTIYLRAHTGKRLTVQGEAVHAKWDHQGAWQALVIEKAGAGAIHVGDTISLRAHTGDYLVAESGEVAAEPEPEPEPESEPEPETTAAPGGMDPRCASCTGHAPCIWAGQCYTPVAKEVCESMSENVWCGDVEAVPAPTPSPESDPRCAQLCTQGGHARCIWAGVCYPAVAKDACLSMSENMWCGAAPSLAQVGAQETTAMRRKVSKHNHFLGMALIQAGAALDRAGPVHGPSAEL